MENTNQGSKYAALNSVPWKQWGLCTRASSLWRVYSHRRSEEMRHCAAARGVAERDAGSAPLPTRTPLAPLSAHTGHHLPLTRPSDTVRPVLELSDSHRDSHHGPLGLRLTNTPRFPGCAAGVWKVRGLLSLHDRVSQILKEISRNKSYCVHFPVSHTPVRKKCPTSMERDSQRTESVARSL